MEINGIILFKEIQYFRSKWLWVLIILILLACTGIICWSAWSEKVKSGETWIAWLVFIVVMIAMLRLFYITRFEKIVTAGGIYYKWWPFQKSYRLLSKDEIEKTELRKTPFLIYGFHFIPGYGRVHNVSPGKGIQFTMRNGKRIFLGTQKHDEFQSVLEKIMSLSRRL